jgi:hypothetical protein
LAGARSVAWYNFIRMRSSSMKKKLAKSKPRVKKVALVRVPRGHVPVVHHDPVKSGVVVVPVPEEKKNSWWDNFVGAFT